MKFTKLIGLIAAPFTPMKKDGSINPGLIRHYADHLKMNGVSGVFVCGTTGEGMLLTLKERETITEHWIAEQTEEFKVIVHVGTTSSGQSAELAKHAQESGAYAIGCMGPMFLKPERVEELVVFCAEVAVGAPNLPFYYYHIPTVSGVNLSMPKFLQKAKGSIPSLVGIKFTYSDAMEMMQCLTADNGKWDILHGLDEELISGLGIGISGAVGSTYNYIAPVYHELIKAFEGRDINAARYYQCLSLKFIDILKRYGGGVAGGKPVMKFVGIDCGPLRAPVYNLSEEESAAYFKKLENIGFFDWAAGDFNPKIPGE